MAQTPLEPIVEEYLAASGDEEKENAAVARIVTQLVDQGVPFVGLVRACVLRAACCAIATLQGYTHLSTRHNRGHTNLSLR
jgi:hypothetical protein